MIFQQSSRWLSRLVVGALVLTCAFASREAWATDTRYQDFVLGGRAMGLGGAFTSIADDSSGVYYNPAGLADLTSSSISVSTSLYGFEQGSSSSLPVAGLERLNVDFSELVVIPATAGFVQSFGEKGPDGRAIQGYGLTIVVPSFRSFSSSSPQLAGGGTQNGFFDDAQSSYNRRVTDRSLWAGLGYGRKVGSRLQLGISGFYILRSAVDVEEVATAATVRGSNQQAFRTASNEVSYLNGSGLFILGAKYKLTQRIGLGLAVQTPSFALHSQGRLRFSRGISVPVCDGANDCDNDPVLQGGPMSRYETVVIDDAKSQTRQGMAVRLGANYVEPYKFTLSADVSYHAPVSYELISIPDEQQRQLLPFEPGIQRNAVVNVNVGGEFLVIREVSVSAGVFTNFSTAPAIPENPTRDQPAKADLLGLTMAVGYFGKHSISRLGVVYSFGSGRDVVPENTVDRLLEDKQSYRSVDLFQSFFYVFLSSSFRY